MKNTEAVSEGLQKMLFLLSLIMSVTREEKRAKAEAISDSLKTIKRKLPSLGSARYMQRETAKDPTPVMPAATGEENSPDALGCIKSLSMVIITTAPTSLRDSESPKKTMYPEAAPSAEEIM